jgi:hypothetical protein
VGLKNRRHRFWLGGIWIVVEKSRSHQQFSVSAMTFHENAGLSQVDFDWPFLKFPFPSWRRVCRAARSSQGRVLCGVSEPLTARTALSPFRQEGKGAVARDLVFLLFLCSAPRATLSPPFHPHSQGATCSLGASWVFSFQPVLPPVCRPLFPSRDGSWARP